VYSRKGDLGWGVGLALYEILLVLYRNPKWRAKLIRRSKRNRIRIIAN